RITEARRCARHGRGPDFPVRGRDRAQHRQGSLALMPGHISGDDGSIGTTAVRGTTTIVPGATMTPGAGVTTAAGGGTTTVLLGPLADGCSNGVGQRSAVLTSSAGSELNEGTIPPTSPERVEGAELSLAVAAGALVAAPAAAGAAPAPEAPVAPAAAVPV